MSEIVLDPDHIRRVNELISVREKLRLDPRKSLPWLFRKCTVRVLLVADGFLFFDDSDFGLGEFLRALSQSALFVRFEVTCAHRSQTAAAQSGAGRPGVARTISGFDFADPAHFGTDLYDELWIFGSVTSRPSGPGWTNRPSDAELRAISEFMDAGHGVFATGDHGSLGAALGGFLPRVRSMRRWFDPPGGPLGEPVAPDMTSSHRRDTNRPGASGTFDFGDQSDMFPQPILPVWQRRPGPGLLSTRWPHPLLCGSNGVINVLPDHPHEGECVERRDIPVGQEFDFDGYHVDEYPRGADSRPLPSAVAHSTVLPNNNVKDPTEAAMFVAISAYDGEEAGVGRVVTDATWHHFININLVGQQSGQVNDPDKRFGFLTPGGQHHLRAIEEYFRNIAMWIAPAGLRRCMFRNSLWYATWGEHLVEAVAPIEPLDRVTSVDFLNIGRHAFDSIGRFAGQCQTLHWSLDVLKDILSKKFYQRVLPVPIPELPDRVPGPPLPWLRDDLLVELALGGAVMALRDAYPDLNAIDPDEAAENAPGLVRRGAALALRSARDSLVTAQRDLQELSTALGGVD
ncbi:hypothetical protein ABZ835_48490 [Streptomyces sp. NPDC047461]|uniref:hypothetical protein n=1 Tax=Streptomyces sp. NPDC047461 TaxID=3155619 RepID=UPI0033FC531A